VVTDDPGETAAVLAARRPGGGGPAVRTGVAVEIVLAGPVGLVFDVAGHFAPFVGMERKYG